MAVVTTQAYDSLDPAQVDRRRGARARSRPRRDGNARARWPEARPSSAAWPSACCAPSIEPVLAVKEDPETAAKPIAKIVAGGRLLAPLRSRPRGRRPALAARLSAFVDVIHALDLPGRLRSLPLGGRSPEIKRRDRGEMSPSEARGHPRSRLEKRQIRVNNPLPPRAPRPVIADVARQIDCQLIVMGTRGRSGLAHVLLGSVAERTLRTAPCSVLCVQAADARSTVAARAA